MGTVEDLTGMAIFLASSESDYVVAQTHNVDGGNWMSLTGDRYRLVWPRAPVAG